MVTIWNGLTGVKEVKSFKNAKAGASKIWARIQGLGEVAKPAPEAAKKPAGGAKATKGAPAKGKSGKKGE